MTAKMGKSPETMVLLSQINDSAVFEHVANQNFAISGEDFRWGLEAQWHWNNLEFQGEYVQANINDDKADGWYALANYTFLKKYQAVAFAEKYNDLNPATSNNAWHGLGFNYQISGKTKLMTDFKTQQSATKTNYLGEIQLQVFFN